MNNLIKETIGSGITVLGTVTAAIGSTPTRILTKETLRNLNIYGNVLQATGNGLQADAKEPLSLGQIGNQVTALGNISVVASFVLDLQKITEGKLFITGNWLQALGETVEIAAAIEDDTGLVRSFNVIGNSIQAIGNSLQAIGKIFALLDCEKEGELLIFKGSWIQAVGAFITFLAVLRKGAQLETKNRVRRG
ncbi:DUF6944 family repetitive protein [Ectobacillus polymachus]|uniref:DUF6944 family repetitive protein n=1 Tax=Ectobacillus polymachus TaxID=1508806 RepID=UPI003A836D0A